MKHLIRLLIALLLGLGAAFLNWLWMSRELDYPEYVYVSEPIPLGTRITKDKLLAVPVKGEADVLSKILVPWSQKELWYDRFAAQDYFANQPLFQRDMQDTPTARQWDTLGPFRLVGVGNEPTAAFSGESGTLIPVSGNILTLAIDDSQETEKALLYRYLAAMRGEYYFNETSAERNLLKIIGVEPTVSSKRLDNAPDSLPPQFGAESQPAVPSRSQEFAGQRLIFVSLENIPNAPTWLRIGEEIHFMVPPGKTRLLTATQKASVADRSPRQTGN